MCNIIKNWTSVWDDEQKSVYSYYEDEWIGHDNKDSVRVKVSKIKNRKILISRTRWKNKH